MRGGGGGWDILRGCFSSNHRAEQGKRSRVTEQNNRRERAEGATRGNQMSETRCSLFCSPTPKFFLCLRPKIRPSGDEAGFFFSLQPQDVFTRKRAAL